MSKKIGNIYTKKPFNFVDPTLGNSTNYHIEITTDSTNEDIQRKVYSNAALFQLEAVYNEFKPYINRIIRQSHVVNKLYKAQLVNQLPCLFTQTDIDNLSSDMIIDSESQRHEVLGKLTHNIILPAIKYRTYLDLL